MKEKNRTQKVRMAVEVCEQLPPTMKKAMGLAQEKGTSVWLTVLPIEEHGFALHKGAFRDAMALRYGWRPHGMPTVCICGKQNDIGHALSCARGGYVIIRHNKFRCNSHPSPGGDLKCWSGAHTPTNYGRKNELLISQSRWQLPFRCEMQRILVKLSRCILWCEGS